MMVLPRLAGAGEAGALESLGIGGEKSPMAKMSEKFSELLETVTAIREKNVSLVDGFKKVFSRKGSEKTPQELRAKAEQKDRFDKIYDVLVEIRDSMEGGGMGGKGFLSKMKGMFGKGKGFLSGLLDNPLVAAIIGGSIAPIVASLTGFLKAGIAKVFGGAAALVPFAKFLTITAVVIDNMIDGIKGWFKSSEWEVNKFAGAAGGILGGSGSGWLNALYKAGTFAYVGAKIGALAGPPGVLIGGTLGAIMGAIAGFFGGEKVAKWLDGTFSELFDPASWVISQNISKGLDTFSQWFDDVFGDMLDSLERWWRDNLPDWMKENKVKQVAPRMDQHRSDNDLTKIDSSDTSGPSDNQPDGQVPTIRSTLKNSKVESKGATPRTRVKKSTPKETGQQPTPAIKEEPQPVGQNRSAGSDKQIQPVPLSMTAAYSYNGIVEQGQQKLAALGKPLMAEKQQEDETESAVEERTKNAIMTMENDNQIGYDPTQKVYAPYTDVDQHNDNKGLAIAHGQHYVPENIEVLNSPIVGKEVKLRKVEVGDRLTEEQAKNLLDYRYHQFKVELQSHDAFKDFYSKLSPAVQGTLVNMAYQMGMQKLLGFNQMRNYLRASTDEQSMNNPKRRKVMLARAGRQVTENFDMMGKKTGNTVLFDQTPQRAQAYRKSIENEVVYTLKHDQETGGRKPVYLGPKAEGFIAKKPSLIMTGEYNGAGENPEVTIQMNALENRVLATTNKIIEMKRNQEEKNPVLLNSALESKTINTINTSRNSEERVMMKENLERKVVQMQMPVVNNVVDNKTINNTNAPILIRKTSRNESNPFLVG